MHFEFPSIVATSVSASIREPSSLSHIIFTLGSMILKDASNHLEPHNIDSSLHRRIAL